MTEANAELSKGCIVTFSDGKAGEKIVPATEIYEELRNRGLWYVRRNIAIDEPTVVFFYRNQLGIVGRGIAIASQLVSQSDAQTLKAFGLSKFNTKLAVKDWSTLRRPIAIPPLVSTLDFIRNKVNWGASLRTSPIFLSSGDVKTLLQVSRDSV